MAIRSLLLNSAVGLGSFFYLACSLIAASPVNAFQDSDDKLSQVKQAIDQQKTTIRRVNSERAKLESTLKQNELAIAAVVKKLNQTQQGLANTKKKLAQLDQQQKHLSKQKKQQETLLAKQLRAAYSSGNHDYIKLLLNQQDPGEVQRNVSYYQYLNKARISEIEQFKSTIDELEQVELAQRQQAQQLESLQVQQAKQKQDLDAGQAQREQTLKELNKELLSSQQQLEQLEQQEAELVAALARIAKLSQQEVNLKGLDHLKRKLSWPVNGKIRRSFGSRKQGYLKWKGVLMSAPLGNTIKTIHNGTVLFSDWLKGYGLVIVVDHGDGYMSLYGHNQALLKSVGDRVETGEPIALVGQSGGQSQPGLYFEIRHNGEAVNPKLWCR
ncbi:murein hydrolase activator EnvC family protein [Thalassotalea ganghwensis]